MKCGFCESVCVKNGKRADGTQKYCCKACKEYQQAKYRRRAFKPDTTAWILRLTKEGCGINNIKRLPGNAKGKVTEELADRYPTQGFRRRSTKIESRSDPQTHWELGPKY